MSRISGVSGAFLSNRPVYSFMDLVLFYWMLFLVKASVLVTFLIVMTTWLSGTLRVKDLFWLTVSTCLSRGGLAGTPHTLMYHVQSALAEGEDFTFKACPWWWASTSYVPCPQGPTSWGLSI